MLEDAENKRFDIILCKTQSRFTRELELVEKYIHGLFPVWGIRFVSTVDNADTANKGNKKSRQINGLVNEWYLEDMSDSIKSVLDNKRKKGIHIGAFAPYGYKKDPDRKGHLIIDEEAAAVVREVFTLFSKGYGKTAIARILNDRKIPNPTEYKRLQGMRYKQPATANSTLWKYFSIADMLRNEVYIGNMVQGKYGSISYKTKQNKPRPKSEWYRVENTHEAIIDRELWDCVQALLRQRTKPFSTGKVGLFAGKARCANCGYTLCSSKNRGRHYLQCPNRHVSKDSCIGAFILTEKLEAAVTAELNRFTEKYLDTDALEGHVAFADSTKEEKKKLETDIALCEKKLAEYTEALRQLYLDKVRGIIPESDYILFSKDFSEEKKHLEYMIADHEEQLGKMEDNMHKADGKSLRIGQYVSLQHLSREVVETMIDYISVSKRIPGTQKVPIEIHWKF